VESRHSKIIEALSDEINVRLEQKFYEVTDEIAVKEEEDQLAEEQAPLDQDGPNLTYKQALLEDNSA